MPSSVEQLQWSRNLRVAERSEPSAARTSSPPLQWSRNLRVAERIHRTGAGAKPRGASMEPQLEGCGKHIDGRHHDPEAQASMEPQLEGCGKQKVAGVMKRMKNASMEPQLEGCGKRPWRAGTWCGTCFNGAAT